MGAVRVPFSCIDAIPVLRIAGTAQALPFYRDFLGFTVDWENRIGADRPGYLQLSRAGCVLHLSEHPGDAGMASNVFVRARGVRALAAELAARAGAFPAPAIKRTFHRSVQFEVADPFGNRLRFDEADEDWIDPAAATDGHHDDTD